MGFPFVTFDCIAVLVGAYLFIVLIMCLAHCLFLENKEVNLLYAKVFFVIRKTWSPFVLLFLLFCVYASESMSKLSLAYIDNIAFKLLFTTNVKLYIISLRAYVFRTFWTHFVVTRERTLSYSPCQFCTSFFSSFILLPENIILYQRFLVAHYIFLQSFQMWSPSLSFLLFWKE